MIKNLTSKKKIASKKIMARSFMSRVRGLMFTLPKEDTGLVMVFEKEMIISLHMFFVFYPIDILWLDSKKRVVEFRKFAFPFMPWIEPGKKAMYVVELPVYSIDGSKTKVGDKISF